VGRAWKEEEKKAGQECEGIVGRAWKEEEKKAGQEYQGMVGRAWKAKKEQARNDNGNGKSIGAWFEVYCTMTINKTDGKE
jgi:hypothetical protein